MKDNNRTNRIWLVRIILLIAIIMWMSTIFGFSAEDGSQSQSLSDKITIRVVHMLNSEYDGLSDDGKKQYFNQISFIVRKTGHFCEYAILGALIVCLLLTFRKIRRLQKSKTTMSVMSTGIAMLYASTDEIHQGFVAGRSPKVMDVCIDTAGGLTGAMFIIIIFSLIMLYIKRRQNEFMGKEY